VSAGLVVASPALRSEGGSGASYVFLRTLIHEKRRVSVVLASRLRAVGADGVGPPQGGGAEGGQGQPVVPLHELEEMVVIKVTDRRFMGAAGEHHVLLEDPYNEIAAMRLLGAVGGHRNVLPLLDAMEDDDYIYTVLPYVPGGDLYYRLRASPQPFPMDEARRIFVDTCRGVCFMKQHQLAHR
jgi:serine/threonine protein kinase